MALQICRRIVRLGLTQQRMLFKSLRTAACPPQKGLVLGCYYDDERERLDLTLAAEQYNKCTEGKLLEQIKLAGSKIKHGKSVVFWGLTDEFPAVAVVGLGKQNQKKDELENVAIEEENVRIAAAVGCKALNDLNVPYIWVESFNGFAESAAEGSKLAIWKYQEMKTKKDIIPKIDLYEFCINDKPQWKCGTIKADAQNMARYLTDTPANLMTPTIFANYIQNMFKGCNNIDIKIHDKQWAEKEQMNAFLAIAKGSDEQPKFIELSYTAGDNKPIVLVGKGVTFDAGGISIKPAASMDEMRGDMGGAACVVSVVHALAQLNINVCLKLLIPLCENLISGRAIKPGDVIKAKNGKTICVDNTDAEGRLILADALAYSCKYKPKWVLDVATLTGAMRVALGNAATGVFTNSNKLYNLMEEAGYQTGDRVWRLPLWKHYTKQIATNQGYDLNNIGKGKIGGGSCTAAAFLKQFIPEQTDWLHLDIAGVMGPNDTSIPYLGKGMTGRPTRTIIEFISKQFQKC